MYNYFRRKLYHLVADRTFSDILAGSVWALSARVVSAGLAIFFSIVVARYYGADVLGILAIISTFVMFAAIFILMGTNISVLRLIPEHMAGCSATSAFRVYRRILYLVIGASLPAFFILFFSAGWIATNLFSKPYLGVFFSMAAFFIVAKALMELNTNTVRGLKHIRAFALMQMLPQLSALVILLIMTVLAAGQNSPVHALLISWLITGMVGIVIVEGIFRQKRVKSDPVVNVPLKKIMAISLPMLMAGAMGFLIGHLGVLMLGMFRSETEIGHYFVAVKLATLTTFALKAINTMASPRFAELYSVGKVDELFHVAKKSTKLIFWVTAPILMFFILLGKPVLGFAFGNEFTAAYPALVLLSLGQFANSISGSTGAFMNMTGHQDAFRNIMLATLVLTVTLNLLFIPAIGINGAALSAMISLAFWNFAVLIYIKKKFGRTIGYFPFPVFRGTL